MVCLELAFVCVALSMKDVDLQCAFHSMGHCECILCSVLVCVRVKHFTEWLF